MPPVHFDNTVVLVESHRHQGSEAIDLNRGEMLVRSYNIPVSSMRFDAMLCWMDESASLKIDSPYYIRHTTREVQAFVRDLSYRVDVNKPDLNKSTNVIWYPGKIKLEEREENIRRSGSCSPADV